MIVEFERGIKDGYVWLYRDDYEIDPIIILRGPSGSLHEYRLMDSIVDQDSGEKTYTFRFYQVLTIGEKRL